MVTKPGLAEIAGARFSGGRVLENCERRWKTHQQSHQVRPGYPPRLFVVGSHRALRVLK